MKFFESNELKYRLLRTIVQGVIGVIIANLDVIIDQAAVISAPIRAIIVALVMAILSPIMAEVGKRDQDE